MSARMNFLHAVASDIAAAADDLANAEPCEDLRRETSIHCRLWMDEDGLSGISILDMYFYTGIREPLSPSAPWFALAGNPRQQCCSSACRALPSLSTTTTDLCHGKVAPLPQTVPRCSGLLLAGGDALGDAAGWGTERYLKCPCGVATTAACMPTAMQLQRLTWPAW